MTGLMISGETVRGEGRLCDGIFKEEEDFIVN
jgi:hypothetical protein